MIEIDGELVATKSGDRLTIVLIEENRELKAENERLMEFVQSIANDHSFDRHQRSALKLIKSLKGSTDD